MSQKIRIRFVFGVACLTTTMMIKIISRLQRMVGIGKALSFLGLLSSFSGWEIEP